MLKPQPLLLDIFVALQILAAIIALLYSKKNLKSYWIWFVIYLNCIFLFDFFSNEIASFILISKQNIYAYFIIPLQFFFFYWLYALKSLKSKELFSIFVLIYLASFIPIELYFEKLKVVFSFNYIVGTLLLMVLVFLEFNKQIKNDAILEFAKNKMFYINIGVMLFYVGTLPFFGFYNLFLKEPSLWNPYYVYFLISNSIMSLLFAASFIWGETKYT